MSVSLGASVSAHPDDDAGDGLAGVVDQGHVLGVRDEEAMLVGVAERAVLPPLLGQVDEVLTHEGGRRRTEFHPSSTKRE